MRKGQQFKEFQLWIIHDNLHYSRYANFLLVHPCDDDLLKQRFDDAQKLQHLLGSPGSARQQDHFFTFHHRTEEGLPCE